MFAVGFLLMIIACNQKDVEKKENKLPSYIDTTSTIPNFFPVTAFIKGQIFDINRKGVNPVQYTTVGHLTDSTWLQLHLLEKVFAPFLHPEIDSANMKALFKETSFLDQSINSFTYSYDPIKILPDSVALQHWDVYVDAESSKVSRIYLLKNEGAFQLQLTWIPYKYCKMIWLKKNETNKWIIDKEVLIKWDF